MSRAPINCNFQALEIALKDVYQTFLDATQHTSDSETIEIQRRINNALLFLNTEIDIGPSELLLITRYTIQINEGLSLREVLDKYLFDAFQKYNVFDTKVFIEMAQKCNYSPYFLHDLIAIDIEKSTQEKTWLAEGRINYIHSYIFEQKKQLANRALKTDDDHVVEDQTHDMRGNDAPQPTRSEASQREIYHRSDPNQVNAHLQLFLDILTDATGFYKESASKKDNASTVKKILEFSLFSFNDEGKRRNENLISALESLRDDPQQEIKLLFLIRASLQRGDAFPQMITRKAIEKKWLTLSDFQKKLPSGLNYREYAERTNLLARRILGEKLNDVIRSKLTHIQTPTDEEITSEANRIANQLQANNFNGVDWPRILTRQNTPT